MITLDGATLTASELHHIGAGSPVRLADAARARMAATARASEDGAVPHRIATNILRRKWAWLGAGPPPDSTDELTRSFVLGHCASVGEPMSPALVRATIAARVNVFATGCSGVRPEAADALLALLHHDAIPIVPCQGSLGAAGSSTLAHIARVVCGWGGDVWLRGSRIPATSAGLPTLRPTGKEALALLNGSTSATAEAAVAIVRAERLLRTAEAACALSFEVVHTDLGCLSDRAMAARPHPGPRAVASRLRSLIDGSERCVRAERADPFSFRCAPSVLGAANEAHTYAADVVHRELNGASDNPLVFEDEVIEAGNFHGAPVALAMDHLKTALTTVAAIAERRIFRLTYGQLTGLPSFLVPGTGLNSGLMLAQYTAASLVSEMKGRAHPASVDAIPTVQHLEDHASMAPIAARGATAILEMVADVLAIELLCGAQGLEFGLERAGRGTAAVYATVREFVPKWEEDRVLHPDLAALGRAVRAGAFADGGGEW
jgi:histidine ammonia-lyase